MTLSNNIKIFLLIGLLEFICVKKTSGNLQRMVFGLLQEDLSMPDLQTFLHSELYEIVEEKSRDILEESLKCYI